MTDLVNENRRQFYGIEDLKKAIQEAWDAIPTSYLLKLVNSMPHRVQAIKEMQGKNIPY
jgi:hypothetical protein